MDINQGLVQKLIQEQFPEWGNLPIHPVQYSGHDNRTYHLGDEMAVRLPSHPAYEPQVQKEAKWLPFLAQHLSLPITEPLFKGHPSPLFPLEWSVNKWVNGTALIHSDVDKQIIARELASFLTELYSIDANEGPPAGAHNFYRGGSLSVYHEETQAAIRKLKNEIDVGACQTIWERARSSHWNKTPVWIHGDVAPGNLIASNGHLVGVIDFGTMGIGDPASDLTLAWTYFDQLSRDIFKNDLQLDEDTWNRARGWALWKALITYHDEKDDVKQFARTTYQALLEDE